METVRPPIDVKCLVVDDNNIIKTTTTHTIDFDTNNQIPANSLVGTIAEMQRQHKSDYTFLVQYDPHATEPRIIMDTIPVNPVQFAENNNVDSAGMRAFDTSMILVVLHRGSGGSKNKNQRMRNTRRAGHASNRRTRKL